MIDAIIETAGKESRNTGMTHTVYKVGILVKRNIFHIFMQPIRWSFEHDQGERVSCFRR